MLVEKTFGWDITGVFGQDYACTAATLLMRILLHSRGEIFINWQKMRPEFKWSCIGRRFQMTFVYKQILSRLLTFTHCKIQHKVDKTHVCSQYRRFMSRLRMRDFHFVGAPSLNPVTKSTETSICGGHMKNCHLLVVHSRWPLPISRCDLDYSHLPMAKYSIRLTKHTFESICVI